jgi:hypothetical protein
VSATELNLKGKSPRRNLDLRSSAYGHLSAVLYLVGSKSWHTTSLAYATAKTADSYIHVGKNGKHNLWLGGAAFEISAAEAERIRATYEPLGLQTTKEGAGEAADIKLQSSADAAVHT